MVIWEVVSCAVAGLGSDVVNWTVFLMSAVHGFICCGTMSFCGSVGSGGSGGGTYLRCVLLAADEGDVHIYGKTVGNAIRSCG